MVLQHNLSTVGLTSEDGDSKRKQACLNLVEVFSFQTDGVMPALVLAGEVARKHG